MSPFLLPSIKKIVGADFEKIDKVDFRHRHTYIQTYRHTDGGYLIGPSPAGGPKVENTEKKFGNNDHAYATPK